MISKCPKCGEDELIMSFKSYNAYNGNISYWGVKCDSCGFTVRSEKSVDHARFLWESAGNKNILKPCPFCGSDAIFSDGYNHWYVRCSNQECLVRTRRFLDKSKARDCWNRRVKE